MRVISDPQNLWKAWSVEYVKLARRLATLLTLSPRELVEIGCGRGQLTVPLMEAAPAVRVIAVDSFSGPYSANQERLVAELGRSQLTDRVQIVAGDGLKWLPRQPRGKFDAVVSSEFLPEVSSSEMAAFFRSCCRAVRAGGVTAHVFLSPNARNRGQELTIEADSDPRWRAHTSSEWFSPSPELASASLVLAGFIEVAVQVLRSGLRFTGGATRDQLAAWGVHGAFERSHRRDLLANGLELPDWIILSGKRPR